jgi:hypothetical protein
VRVLKLVVDEMPTSRSTCRFYDKDACFEFDRCRVGKSGRDYCTYDSSRTCTHLVLKEEEE